MKEERKAKMNIHVSNVIKLTKLWMSVDTSIHPWTLSLFSVWTYRFRGDRTKENYDSPKDSQENAARQYTKQYGEHFVWLNNSYGYDNNYKVLTSSCEQLYLPPFFMTAPALRDNIVQYLVVTQALICFYFVATCNHDRTANDRTAVSQTLSVAVLHSMIFQLSIRSIII